MGSDNHFGPCKDNSSNSNSNSDNSSNRSNNSNNNNNSINNHNNHNSSSNANSKENKTERKTSKSPINQEGKSPNMEKGRAYGCGCTIGKFSCYAEKTSEGDYNAGLSISKSIDKGPNSFSSGAYTEITYNKEDGISFGCGYSNEISNSVSKQINAKGVKMDLEVYKSDYASEDKIRKHLCC